MDSDNGLLTMLDAELGYPALAEKGLGAAKRYAKIAPAAPHAQHMPSHIFTRVGYWNDSIASNKESAQKFAAPDIGCSAWPMAGDPALTATPPLPRPRPAQLTKAPELPATAVEPKGAQPVSTAV